MSEIIAYMTLPQLLLITILYLKSPLAQNTTNSGKAHITTSNVFIWPPTD